MPRKAPLSRFYKPVAGGNRQTTRRAFADIRRYILKNADVIQHLIDVANGVMPEKWAAALNPTSRGKDIPPPELTLEHMMRANEVLLKCVLPQYRQADASAGEAGESIASFEDAKATAWARIDSIIRAHGGDIDEEGNITLPAEFKIVPRTPEIDHTAEVISPLF